ncbi:MAG: hypothetical protein GXX01_09100 [Clostridiales bacterium]|jgi:hypothetical protein|nr:hypothetical protein [Clostridiales bacterium]
MCKYDYQCKLCGFKIDVKAEYKDMQDVVLKVSSDCPNLNPVTKEPIVLDAMYELMVPKEKSAVMQLLKDKHRHIEECTAYESIRDAIGLSLGRYFEIA